MAGGRIALIMALALLALAVGNASRASAAEPQLEYLGHIAMPQVPWDQPTYEAGKHFGWSTGVFCYVPDRDSFFVLGHRNHQLVAEVSNPGPGKRAELKHGFVDLTRGALKRHAEETQATLLIEGLLHARGRVWVSCEKWYNVDNQRVATHGSCLPDLADPQFSGWWHVGRYLGQSTGFYMAELPPQDVRDGHWLLTGGSISWRVPSSAGPCAILTSPDGAASDGQQSARELLRYPPDPDRERVINLLNPADRQKSRYAGGVEGWMGNCHIGGAAVVGRRLIFFGRQGLGFDYYGPTEDYRKLSGLSEPFEGKGYECGPYEAAMWIYNLDALQQGNRAVARVPFRWALSPRGHADLRGAAIHGDRLYVSEAFGEYFGDEPLPVIHVLKLRSQ